jgi:anti-sigma regulatory factor (Ser/Thr protein kinase)
VSEATAAGSWPAEAACVPVARAMVRDLLRADDTADLLDDALLLVSELVGNVVLHVGGTVEVTATLSGSGLLLEVTDDSAATPLLRSFSSTASTGRGLRLVHSLSAEHGARSRDDGRVGKTVWVRLDTASSARSDDEVLASYADVDWLAELDDHAGDERDLGVRAGLRPAPALPALSRGRFPLAVVPATARRAA